MGNSENHFDQEKSITTRAKHELLSKYVKVWTGIIVQYLNTRGESGRLIYIDTCAGTGLFKSDSLEFLDTAGSPLIALNNFETAESYKSLDTTNIRFQAFLTEKNPKLYARLVDSLQSTGMYKDNIKVYPGDYRDKVNEIKELLTKSWGLVFFDPFSIEPIPYSIVTDIIKSGKTDALLFYPWKDVQRCYGRATSKEYEEKDKYIKYLDDFFYDINWRNIGSNSIESEKYKLMYDEYLKKIKNDTQKYCVVTRFMYEDHNQDVYRILILTKSEMAALKSKRYMLEIHALQSYLKTKRLGQSTLLEMNSTEYEMKPDEIVVQMKRKFKGKTVEGRTIYRWAIEEAGEGVNDKNFLRSLTITKKDKDIDNPGGRYMKYDSLVKFR